MLIVEEEASRLARQESWIPLPQSIKEGVKALVVEYFRETAVDMCQLGAIALFYSTGLSASPDGFPCLSHGL